MQTFMTDALPPVIAAHLDMRRLNKQITEGIQIIGASLFGTGWSNHPAVKQWNGHERFLALYVDDMIAEWHVRGFTSHVGSSQKVFYILAQLPDTGPPAWWGDPAIIRTHQSNLIRKDPHHYGPLFPGVPDDLEYIWPSQNPDPTSTL